LGVSGDHEDTGQDPPLHLGAQVLRLAKIWLLDDLVQEITEELVRNASKADVHLLLGLVAEFDLPVLTVVDL